MQWIEGVERYVLVWWEGVELQANSRVDSLRIGGLLYWGSTERTRIARSERPGMRASVW